MSDKKNTTRILLCEDDENLGMLLREYLQAKGYNAELYPDGEAGYKAFLKNKYDICVFDVMMPKKDGFTLAQEIRQTNSEIPIIFLTAKTLKEDVLEGFKIGADDYLTKPFSMEELTFRIEAIFRRVRGKKSKEISVYKIGKFTFRIILTQGLNRQIRRMCQEFGYQVVSLKRIRINGIELGKLTPGQTRPVEGAELKALYQSVGI